jgi:hypothetical protein
MRLHCALCVLWNAFVAVALFPHLLAFFVSWSMTSLGKIFEANSSVFKRTECRVGSHNLNLESSRSHSILTVYIEAMPQRPDAVDYGTPRMGKVSVACNEF